MRRPSINGLRSALLGMAIGVAVAGCGGSTGASTSTSPSTSTSTSASSTSTTQASTTPAATQIPPAQAVGSTNGLAVDLLRRLGSARDNVVFSPYSIETALAMVGVGAEGQTLSQIQHVLRVSNASTFNASNASLAARLGAAITPASGAVRADAPQLNIANGVWVRSGLALKPEFSAVLDGSYAAAAQTADFATAPEAARKQINDWIAGRTANLIQDLLPPGTITVRTALVLANAIYLKAHWQSAFDHAGTAPGPFFTDAGTKVMPPFMTQAPTEFGYAQAPDYVAIDLPYLGSDLGMLLVMPRGGTLARFEAGLTAAQLGAIAQALAPRRVKLSMPRFELVAHRSLNEALSALGMPVAFSDSADFSGITAQEPLKIATVEHGADLKVTEQGTVAAAATGIVAEPTAAAPSATMRVTLDHPFLLFLRDERSGAILFAGRVADPTQR